MVYKKKKPKKNQKNPALETAVGNQKITVTENSLDKKKTSMKFKAYLWKDFSFSRLRLLLPK